MTANAGFRLPERRLNYEDIFDPCRPISREILVAANTYLSITVEGRRYHCDIVEAQDLPEDPDSVYVKLSHFREVTE